MSNIYVNSRIITNQLTMSEINQGREPDTELKILEAAGKVFMKKGRLGASMQDIADEAGINRTLLHYYFRNKDKLFNTVFEEVFQQLFPAVVGIMLSDRPLHERIRYFAETYAGLLKDKPYLPVFIIQELTLNPQRMAGVLRETGIDPRQVLDGFGADLEAAGFRDVDPRHVFASILGMILFPYIARPLFQEIAFLGNRAEYEDFLAVRSVHIQEFMKLAITGTGIQNQTS